MSPLWSIRIAQNLVRLYRTTRASISVEFTMILPILIILLLGISEVSQLLAKSRKLTIATSMLVELASREERLSIAEVDGLIRGTLSILGEDGDAVTIRLASIVSDDEAEATIHWSRASGRQTPYAPGQDATDLLESDILAPDSSAIIGEIELAYTSTATKFLVGSLDLYRRALRWPRLSNRVEMCRNLEDCFS